MKLQNGKPEKSNLVDLDDMDGKAVVYELFYSIMREVRDEVSWSYHCVVIFIFFYVSRKKNNIAYLWRTVQNPHLKCLA